MGVALPHTPLQSATPPNVILALTNRAESPQRHEPTTNTPSFTEAGLTPNQPNKSDFVEGLVDTALLVIQSIWGDKYPGTASAKNTRGLPLRVFVRETLRRSRTSYSTLQTALFYLFRVKALRESQAQKNEATTTGIQKTEPGNTTKRTHGSGNFSLSPKPTPSSPSLPLSPCSLPSSSPITSVLSPEPERPTKRIRREHSSNSKSNTGEPTSSATDSMTGDDPTQCGRRMFLASLMSAAKYLQDRNYSNRAWSKISGLSVEEINRNEMSFLRLIDYRLFVSPPLFRRWSFLLLGHVNTLQTKSSPKSCLLGGGGTGILIHLSTVRVDDPTPVGSVKVMQNQSPYSVFRG